VSYIRLTSLTFWAGILSVSVGILGLIRPEIPHLPEIIRILAVELGADSTSPAGLIALGLGLIGLRKAVADGQGAGDSK